MQTSSPSVPGASSGWRLCRWDTQEQNTRVYAAITRLQTGMLTQQQLIERSRRAREDAERGLSLAGDPQKLQLQRKSEELRSKIATSKTEDASALQNRLDAVGMRLQKLEAEGKFAETIIQSYEPSVCLIHIVMAFRDRTTELRLHYASLTASGEPATDEHNNPLLSLNGKGPEVHLDAFGTGFLVSDSGQILTNHHVAEPWWQNDELKPMLDESSAGYGFHPKSSGLRHGYSRPTTFRQNHRGRPRTCRRDSGPSQQRSPPSFRFERIP
jgi:hypothetical protein